MISVIVPVYNVETYLRKCLDSIIRQTYKDLEVLMIDDGSTDNSGKICDEYEKKDSRFRVFHTINQGLSAARNLGLENAKGDYIGFVDSDDWIEPDMYELLINKAAESNVDVVECGIFQDYVSTTIKRQAINQTVANIDAIEMLIYESILTQVWNKIYRRSVFDNIRFPVGRSFEDIATSYKLIQDATVTGIPEISYHYIQRESSISQSHGDQNLIDNWIAHRQRYEDLKECVDGNAEKELLKYCASAIVRTWIWCRNSRKCSKYVEEMNAFVCERYPLFGYKEWPLSLRFGVFLARFNNGFSLNTAYYLNQIYRLVKPKYYK